MPIYKLLRLRLNVAGGTDGIDTIDIPAGGNPAWGAITGVLADQADLQAALNGKQVAGTYATGSGSASGTNTGDQTTNAFGYATGAGGAVTQLTSKATGVTLNKLSGAITTHNAALAAAAEVKFTVTNNQVAATDVPVAAIKSGGTSGSYFLTVGAVAAGSFDITIGNCSAGSLSQALVINFVIVKAVAV